MGASHSRFMAAAAEPGPVGTGDGDGSGESGAFPSVIVQAAAASVSPTMPAANRCRELTDDVG